MKKVKKVSVLLIIAAVVSFGLTGCRDAGKEGTVAETSTAELAKIKADLAGIMSERDELKMKLAAVTEAHDKLQASAGQTAGATDQLASLTEERDTAVANATEAQSMVEKS